MRIRPLPLIVVLTACAVSDAAEPVLIDDFVERSVPVHCEPAPMLTAREATVEDVASLGDSLLLVLYSEEREVAFVGPDLEVRHVVRFEEDGPTGVRAPVSATLLGDSLVYIADRSRYALKVLDLQGRDRGTVELPFPPQRVRAGSKGIYITPFVMGRHPARLVYRLDGLTVHPVDIPTVRYGDAAINTLANLAGVTPFPDGRVVVTHEFMVPFAHTFTEGEEAEAVRLPVPLPVATGAALRTAPTKPLPEADAGELPVALLSTDADAITGDLLYLTRSGRMVDGRYEKAVVRLDSALGYRSSYLLDVNAIHMSYLAGLGMAVVVDEVDQWYTCPTE